MRAKFVPAESLYPTTQSMTPMSYGAVESTAYTQPMTPAHPSVMGYMPMSVDQVAPSGDTFEMNNFVDQITEDDDQNSFLQTFNYAENSHNEANGFTANPPQIVSPFSISTDKRANGKSKFGFEYESLTDSIEDLELTNPADKELKTKFDQAKFEIEIGNTQEAEKTLKQMMDNKEIKYKDFIGIDNNAFMNAFTPISE